MARSGPNGPSGPLRWFCKQEFVALTFGDHGRLMADAMMGTGWFERTGRSVAAPAGEINEVWRLSRLGMDWQRAATQTQTESTA